MPRVDVTAMLFKLLHQAGERVRMRRPEFLLARLHHFQKRLTHAIELIESYVQLRRKVLGLEHPGTTRSIEILDTWRGEEAELPFSKLSISDDI
jgi:cell division protein FtsB